MKIIRGPWFFANLAGGWRFDAQDGDQTLTTSRYNFSCRPTCLAPLANRIGSWWLGRDIDRRIAAYASACRDPGVIAAVATSEESPQHQGRGTRHRARSVANLG